MQAHVQGIARVAEALHEVLPGEGQPPKARHGLAYVAPARAGGAVGVRVDRDPPEMEQQQVVESERKLGQGRCDAHLHLAGHFQAMALPVLLIHQLHHPVLKACLALRG